jgi:uncharacterized iron-regulated protein
MPKSKFLRLASILLPAALAAQLGPVAGARPAQAPEAHYRVFDSKGRPVKLQEIIDALDKADVLFVGETHNDPVAHLLEAELLRRADEGYGPSSQKKRQVALSLEMFERDVQTVVDEYVGGLIQERNFLLSSRPWNNYQTDYRPLVEYAREHHLPVIAANAPARYVSRVSGLGPDSLRELSPAAKSWLPPLPFPQASEAYASKFRQFMQGASGGGTQPQPPASAQQTTQPARAPSPPQANPHGGAHLLEAQTLRDASMAYAVADYLKRHDALVVHVNGTFHSEERLGVPEQLLHYRPKARVVVVTILPDDGFPNFDAGRRGKLGDFVILTDPSLPRSSS